MKEDYIKKIKYLDMSERLQLQQYTSPRNQVRSGSWSLDKIFSHKAWDRLFGS
jgi:hypothetical protein